MRLIDADKLIEKIWKLHEETEKQYDLCVDELKDMYCGVVSLIDAQPTEPQKKTVSTAAMPCFDCICNHCANCTECWDKCTGEMDEPCFVCEDCKNYDGKGKDMWRCECDRYKITNLYAEKKRKKFEIVKGV